ncbi:protein of unknown function [Streptantibioticus cattleyicolor NRRL 8057 = DSM 46488]|nr:protein of unknown function [Streptantibioticus cattleyicolor NRRL 8057 = DSM 46488]
MNAAPTDAENLLKFLDSCPGLSECSRLLGSLSEKRSMLLFIRAKPRGDGLRFPEKADSGFGALES